MLTDAVSARLNLELIRAVVATSYRAGDLEGVAPAAEGGSDSAASTAAVIVCGNLRGSLRGFSTEHDATSGAAVDGQECIKVSGRVVTSARGEGYRAIAGQTEVIQGVRSCRLADIIWLARSAAIYCSNLADFMCW